MSGLGNGLVSGGTGYDSGSLGGFESSLFQGENPNENLRTFDLPKLDAHATSLQFGDWWNLLDSQMGDLIKNAAGKCDREWLEADPVTKLRLVALVDPIAQRRPQTAKRTLGVLLQSIPEHIKSNLVASQLLIVYQPRGALERTRVLNSITDGKCGDNILHGRLGVD